MASYITISVVVPIVVFIFSMFVYKQTYSYDISVCAMITTLIVSIFYLFIAGLVGGFTGYVADQYYSALEVTFVNGTVKDLYSMYLNGTIKSGQYVKFPNTVYLQTGCIGLSTDTITESDSSGEYTVTEYYWLGPILDCQSLTSCDPDVLFYAYSKSKSNVPPQWDITLRQGQIVVPTGLPQHATSSVYNTCPSLTIVNPYLTISWVDHQATIDSLSATLHLLYLLSLVIPSGCYFLALCGVAVCM